MRAFRKQYNALIPNMFLVLSKSTQKIIGYQIHHTCTYWIDWIEYIIKSMNKF